MRIGQKEGKLLWCRRNDGLKKKWKIRRRNGRLEEKMEG